MVDGVKVRWTNSLPNGEKAEVPPGVLHSDRLFSYGNGDTKCFLDWIFSHSRDGKDPYSIHSEKKKDFSPRKFEHLDLHDLGKNDGVCLR